MPRIARQLVHVPGALVHVIVRFVDGRFLLDDAARARYLGLLAPAIRSSGWRLVSYALMSSHVHLGCVAGSAELRSWALPLHVRFAQWINRRVAEDNPKALGHVIADRPKTKVMCTSRARFLMTYLHRNPVEAGVATDPSDSSWTSHRAYLGVAPCEGGLDIGLGFELAGFEPTARGRQRFHEFVSRTQVGPGDLEATKPASVPTTPPDRVSPQAIIRAVVTALHVPLDELVNGSRRRRVVLARRAALLVWAEHALTMRPMVTALGLSSSAASRLLDRPHDHGPVRTAADRVRAILDEDRAAEKGR